VERTTWSRINELYEAARKLPAGEREAWVRSATADERVMAEVLSMLHVHEDDPWSVGAPGANRTPTRVTPAAAAWPPIPAPGPADLPPAWTFAGTRTPTHPALFPLRRAPEPKAGGPFASYRLVREVSRDATRIVFEAVVTEAGPRPRVALHVLSMDASDAAFSALFHARGDVLARLDHHGLPRLLDGGVTGDGTAFLAFEVAAGEPLDSWCRARDVDMPRRVDRVLAVCDAIQHAHEHLVAHGDLRPANILVSPDGAVKVLDTGMSALLGSGPPFGGAPPALHQYMSPEQARGEVLTAASDVYALGVLLYTLLTGYPPYELGGQAAGRARQLICEAEPDVPSTVVGRRDARVLAGTLDRIILKALRKHPRERYRTAAALAADLRAWRDNRPASVSRVTVWSRMSGGGRGRAIRVGATFLFVLSLVAYAGYLGWQASLLRADRDGARAELADARRRKAADDERLARLTVADRRLEVARITSDLAIAARRGGDAAKAEALWTQALADLQPVLDGGAGDVRALDHAAVARASLGSLCRSQRRLEEGLVHYREALGARERAAALADAPADAPWTTAVAQVDVARLQLDLVEVRPPGPNDAGRLREADALLRQAGPILDAAASASPSQDEARAELDRQAARLSRLARQRR
jgi:hypothetical protein